MNDSAKATVIERAIRPDGHIRSAARTAGERVHRADIAARVELRSPKLAGTVIAKKEVSTISVRYCGTVPKCPAGYGIAKIIRRHAAIAGCG